MRTNPSCEALRPRTQGAPFTKPVSPVWRTNSTSGRGSREVMRASSAELVAAQLGRNESGRKRTDSCQSRHGTCSLLILGKVGNVELWNEAWLAPPPSPPLTLDAPDC